jgi:hypothetical protein
VGETEPATALLGVQEETQDNTETVRSEVKEQDLTEQESFDWMNRKPVQVQDSSDKKILKESSRTHQSE